ncbi:hypothetical protein K3495_g16152, partial [Podosphaera aphanis]
MARALVINLGLSLWAEAIATACYLKNRLPHARLPENTTPYEALQGKKPTIHHLQPFGRNCYVHIHKDSRPPRTKLLPRALEGKFVGYTKSNKIFRIWIPSKNKVIESPTVKFAPLDSGEVQINLENSRNFSESNTLKLESPDAKPQKDTNENISSPTPTSGFFEIPGSFDEPSQLTGRPKRSSKPIKRYGSPIPHGKTLRPREEHDDEYRNLFVVEKIQDNIEYNAVALSAQAAPKINEEPKNI